MNFSTLFPELNENQTKMLYELLDREVIGVHNFEHPANGWCAKTNDDHPAKFKKCGACCVEEQRHKLKTILGQETEQTV